MGQSCVRDGGGVLVDGCSGCRQGCRHAAALPDSCRRYSRENQAAKAGDQAACQKFAIAGNGGAWQEEEVSTVHSFPLLAMQVPPSMPSKPHSCDFAMGDSRRYEDIDSNDGCAEPHATDDHRDAVAADAATAQGGLQERPPGNIFWMHQEDAAPWQHTSPQEVFVGAADDSTVITQRLCFDIEREGLPLQLLGPGAPASGRVLGLWLEEPKLGEEPGNGLLFVSAVEAGSQLRCTAEGDPGVCPGDTIMQVDDDCFTPSAARERLGQLAEEGGRLELSMRRRPPIFEVELKADSAGVQLGLSLGVDARDAYRIKVRQVRTKGMAATWNTKHGALRICTGDWIVQVNGQSRSTKRMYAAIMAMQPGSTLRLLIATPQRHIFQPDLWTSWNSPFPAGSTDNLSPRSDDSDGFVEVPQVPVCFDNDLRPNVEASCEPAAGKDCRQLAWKRTTLAI